MRITRSPRHSLKIKPDTRFWSLHTHSHYSACDAIPSVKELVAKVNSLGQQALGLQDHGNMAGAVELYQACQKAGIAPFPGSELYYVPDTAQHKIDRKTRDGVKASRYHMGVVAFSAEGYENLVTLSTNSHKNHFHKPLVDDKMLAQLAEDGKTQGLAITTGCYFSWTVQQLIHSGPEKVKQHFAMLESWFPGSVYVEVQNHNIVHEESGWSDDKVADALFQIAEEMGLPLVITQDSHYLDLADKAAHDDLKQLVAFGQEPDEALFPGDGFHVADGRWIRGHHRPDRFERGMEGLGDLLSRHRLSIPVLDAYSYSVPKVTPDPQGVMEDRCWKRLVDEHLDTEQYVARLNEEISVIKDVDMAGYMVLVAEVTDWMREHDVVFQTRGSAAGSIVCWLLGITQVDPIYWDLRFERFLSRDRTKPPDIDLDIAHDRRDELMSWLDSRFTAHQIGTWMKFSLTKSEEDGESGSLLEQYFSAASRRGKPNMSFGEVPKEDMDSLERLSDLAPYKGMGTNAAGVVLTSTPHEFDSLVPLAHRNAGGFVTQCHLKVVEDLGLVKLDVLGSKTLTVLKRCMDNLGKPVSFLDEIPLGDKDVYKLISSGDTAGIFQLEGKSSMWGVKSLRPNSIKDVIAAMALFRPGPMDAGSDKAYIARKYRKEPIPDRHPLINKVTKPTYGVVLYQEQVIDILRELGMGADDLTAFLKAVKASNANVTEAGRVIASYTDWIHGKCEDLGMSEDEIAWLDETFAGFANYGFNRAHATVYGMTAYRCAWLAVYYPVEFYAALLSVAAGGVKEAQYLRATRRRGVMVKKPDLNVSKVSYTVDQRKRVIRKGLLSVDGIGMTTATCLAEHAPYESIEDLIRRTPNQPITGGMDYNGDPESLTGVLEKLREAGLLDGLNKPPPIVRTDDPESSHEAAERYEPKRNTAKARVLKYLREHQDTWLDAPDFTKPEIGGFAGTRRLRELRHEGWPIETRTKPGTTNTWQHRLTEG